MSEKINPDAIEALSQRVAAEVLQKVTRRSKSKLAIVALLMAVLAVAASGYLSYLAYYGKYGMRMQGRMNHGFNIWLADLATQNRQLQAQIVSLSTEQDALRSEIKKINPSQTSLIIAQLNNLLSGANQSLVIYHDYAAAIKLLNYAKQVLTTTSDPLFARLKVNVVNDLDKLQLQNSYDNVMLAIQLDDIAKQAPSLELSAPLLPAAAPLTATTTLWDKFLANLKASLLGLVKISKSTNGSTQILLPENEMIVRQHLQLDLQGARQALLTHNQQLWQSSLSDVSSLITQNFIINSSRFKVLALLGQLAATSFATDGANLDLSMQELIKLEQLAP